MDWSKLIPDLMGCFDIQSGKEHVLGWSNCRLPVLKGAHKKDWRETIYRHMEWQAKGKWLKSVLRHCYFFNIFFRQLLII